MAYSDEIKKIREKCFLTQELFGRELGVSFSTVNRWENEKSKPNMSAMKKMKELDRTGQQAGKSMMKKAQT